MHFGNLLKFYRHRKGMTQSELANGIISISYLSKIENKFVNPPYEVKELLCQKLGMDPLSLEKISIHNLCDNWFRELFYRNINASIKIYRELCRNRQLITVQEMHHLFEIHKLRFYIILNRKQNMEEQFQKLQLLSPYFSAIENYYWLKFSGQYYFSRELYKRAIGYFQNAMDYLPYVDTLKEEEKHDLLYMVALSASYVRDIHTTLVNTSHALLFYQKQYDFKRAAKCHILLGITYARLRNYEDSMNSYQHAKKIADRLNDTDLQAKCYQNIGHVYSSWNQSEQSIEYYKKSFMLRDESRKKLYPVIGLVKEYYHLNDTSNARDWLNKGLAIAGRDNQSIYHYELDVYEQLINGVSSKLEEIILQKIIPYTEKKQLHMKRTDYLEILAKYYYDQRKYKQAAIYFNHALLSTRNI